MDFREMKNPCEAWVINELMKAQDEIEMLKNENKRFRAVNEELRKRVGELTEALKNLGKKSMSEQRRVEKQVEEIAATYDDCWNDYDDMCDDTDVYDDDNYIYTGSVGSLFGVSANPEDDINSDSDDDDDTDDDSDSYCGLDHFDYMDQEGWAEADVT